MPANLAISSPCKVNLILNILGRRTDGFHELETLMHPVALCDELQFEKQSRGISLSCSEPGLPIDSNNLVYRAAERFLAAARIPEGIQIHLEKRIPMAAGLGGGSGNAAATLLGLNELFGSPLSLEALQPIAAGLGSDVPFFLQNRPALATGRGERIEALETFSCLKGRAFLLIHPGFGIATAWAYKELARFPSALNGVAGRARELAVRLGSGRFDTAASLFYNSLEAPALDKYPLLSLYQEFLRSSGALATLMSGSGSTTFAIMNDIDSALELEQRFLAKFGACWTKVVAI